jgi:hypothetical protein
MSADMFTHHQKRFEFWDNILQMITESEVTSPDNCQEATIRRNIAEIVTSERRQALQNLPTTQPADA